MLIGIGGLPTVAITQLEEGRHMAIIDIVILQEITEDQSLVMIIIHPLVGVIRHQSIQDITSHIDFLVVREGVAILQCLIHRIDEETPHHCLRMTMTFQKELIIGRGITLHLLKQGIATIGAIQEVCHIVGHIL